MPICHFEDFVPGMVMRYGARTVTRDEIVDFAARFDPQPMHLDEEAGRASILGGLAASGWHTAAIMMRLNAEHLLNHSTSFGAPGVDEVRWLKPVRPGDRLSVRAKVVETRASRSLPDRGFVSIHFELLNQDGATVMTQDCAIMLGCRAGLAAGEAA